MSRGLVVIAHNALADPRRAGPAAEPHLIHEEIPIIEEVLRAAGWEPLALPVGADILGALGALAARRPRAVVNLCDDLLGRSDHEMHFAGALELLGIPYTGAPPLALGLCRDKVKTKLILRGHGIPTAPFVLAEEPGRPPRGPALPRHRQARRRGRQPRDHGRERRRRTRTPRAARSPRCSDAYGPVLVEEFIEGRELNVPVLGNAPPRVLPVSEIDFTGLAPGLPHICGYEAKWEQADARYAGTVGVCPAALDGQLQDRIEHWSALAFRVARPARLRPHRLAPLADARPDGARGEPQPRHLADLGFPALGPRRGDGLPGVHRATDRGDARPGLSRKRFPFGPRGPGTRVGNPWFARLSVMANVGYPWSQMTCRKVSTRARNIMSILLILPSRLAVALAVAWALGPISAGAQGLDPQLQEIRTLIREKRFPLALESLRLVARQIQDLRLETVAPAFPAAPAGWTALPAAEPPRGGRDLEQPHRRPAGVCRQRQGRRAWISRSTCTPRSARRSRMSFNPIVLAGDPLSRLVPIGSEKALVRFNPDTGEGELRVLVGRETLVTARGRGIGSPEILLDLARGIDYPLLSRSTRTSSRRCADE